jgi:D-alanyl-D-alanine carboxypeptidase
MPKGTKLLAVAAAAVVIVWGSARLGNWDNVWGAKEDNAATQPAASPSEPPSASAPAAENSGASAGSSSEPSAEAPAAPSAEPDDTSASGDSAGLAESVAAMLRENAPDRTIEKNADGLAVVNNEDSLLVLVNKKRNLPSDYTPPDLVVPNVEFSFSGESEKKYMRKDAAKALEELFAGAKDDGIELKAVSGYRSYARQKAIFDSNAKQKGDEVANRTSAHPGQSEHQTGLAMDVSSASADYSLETTFGDTKEGKWLASHAHEYGFIIRYPKGKQDITGYTYEPWHVRYVGKDVAEAVYRSGLTLEQYLEKFNGATKA